jgi:NMD protein affecting ribosome stability and mRNA decay
MRGEATMPTDDCVTCRHEVFFIPGGIDKTRCQGCGLAASDAVVWQRVRIVELERALGAVASALPDIAEEIDDLASTRPEVSESVVRIAERLRKIALALYAASPPEASTAE